MADGSRPLTRSKLKEHEDERDNSSTLPQKKQKISEVRESKASRRLPDNVNYGQKKDRTDGEALYQMKTKETFNIKLPVNDKPCWVWSMCILDSGDILIPDFRNCLLKQINGDTYKIRYFLDLHAFSHSVCKTSGTEAFVAMANNSIQFVSTQNELSATRTLSMDHECLGVCVMSDNMFITDGCNRNVFIYDMEGTRLRKVDGQNIFSWNRFIAGGDDGNSIYVTDMNEGLIKMDRNGEVIWKSSVTCLKEAFDVCANGLGYVFASGYKSRNVVQISSDGQFIDEIIPSSVCPSETAGLCFDERKKKLFVAKCDCDDIYVYCFK